MALLNLANVEKSANAVTIALAEAIAIATKHNNKLFTFRPTEGEFISFRLAALSLKFNLNIGVFFLSIYSAFSDRIDRCRCDCANLV